MIRLLVGLGNPGKEYSKTRHNLGFMLLDGVAKELGIKTWRTLLGSKIAETKLGETKIILLQPQNFMNRSGEQVSQILNYFDVPIKEVAIALDDVYIAPGSGRIRKSGGDGGHNGLKSVIGHLEDSFWRVRIGAGLYEQDPQKREHHPPLDEYVLQPMPAHEQKMAKKLIDKVIPDLLKWLEHGELVEKTIHL